MLKNNKYPGSQFSLLRNRLYFYVTLPSLHYITHLTEFQDVWYNSNNMHIEKNIRKLHNLHHIQYLHCNQIHIYSLNSRDNNPSFKSPPLIPFTSVSVPPDVLLNRLQVLTVPDLPDEPPEHVRQPLNHKIAALYIMRAHLAAVKLRAACTRRTRINRTLRRAVLPVSAFPIITRHYITPLDDQPASASERSYNTVDNSQNADGLCSPSVPQS